MREKETQEIKKEKMAFERKNTFNSAINLKGDRKSLFYQDFSLILFFSFYKIE